MPPIPLTPPIAPLVPPFPSPLRPSEVDTNLWMDHNVRVAAAYADAHVSRSDDPSQVAKYLALTGLPYAARNGTPYAFCAAGQIYVGAHSLCDLTQTAYSADNAVHVFGEMLSTIDERWFKPSAACHEIAEDAARRPTWVPRKRVLAAISAHSYTFRPGCLVFYNWQLPSDPSLADPSTVHHVEMILSIVGQTLKTIGFNTSDSSLGDQGDSGVVAYKTRDLSCLVGVLDPTRK